jgi:YD repeat-containing protein
MPLEVSSTEANIARALVQNFAPDGTVAITSALAVDDVEFDTVVPPPRPLATTFGPPSSSNPSGMAAEPINTATGNYLFQRTDLTIPGRGIPFVFTRTYNSLDTYSGPLGHGWTHSYNVVLTENMDGVVVIKFGYGHEEFYDPQGDGNYRSQFPGVFNILVKNADGSFTLTFKDQTQYEFARRRTGPVRGIGDSEKLTLIKDRNGNTLDLEYDNTGNLRVIIDTVGRDLLLDYDENDRIIQLTDPIGRQIRYSYDDAGNLASDTDPSGGVMRYSYDADHRVA